MKTAEAKIRPIFGGHEKFVFRHGWLKKGVDAILKSGGLVFAQDQALIELGVGKNMVRSIRHWCLATGVAREIEFGGGNARPLAPTRLGEKLLGEGGWDPYLEDIGSLWLLHWQLVTNLERGYLWHLLFSVYIEPEFTRSNMLKFLTSQLNLHGIRTTEGAVERELEICLRTYFPAKTKLGAISEETLDCPLAELDIVRLATDDNVYRFNIGPKVSLPVGVFGYGLLMFLEQAAQNRRTVGIDELIYTHGSPGQVSKLDENTVIAYVEAFEKISAGKIRLQESAGLMQVYLDEKITDFAAEAMNALREHYEQH
ncbi:MAG: DUF4007 family protein [Anaerolineales bacterium]